MSDFNPALVFLANIYADAFSNRQTTEVYANGVMQVSIFVSVNYNGNADGIEDKIKDYVRDNVVIYRLRDNGDKEEVDWIYSDTSNGFPHDIEYHDGGGTASDIRIPFYFTVPPGSVAKHRWIAKMGEQETSTNTPVTINARKFQPLADGSQFEFVKRVSRDDHNSLSVIRYKAGAFPDTQKLVKAHKYKGIKFTSTGGNSWLSRYKLMGSAVFVEYKDDHINLANSDTIYQDDEYEADTEYEGFFYAFENWDGPTKFSSSELDKAWIDGVVIVQCGLLTLLPEYGKVPEFDTYKLQDNFGNIVEIKMDFDGGDDWDDWKIKSAVVHYP